MKYLEILGSTKSKCQSLKECFSRYKQYYKENMVEKETREIVVETPKIFENPVFLSSFEQLKQAIQLYSDQELYMYYYDLEEICNLDKKEYTHEIVSFIGLEVFTAIIIILGYQELLLNAPVFAVILAVGLIFQSANILLVYTLINDYLKRYHFLKRSATRLEFLQRQDQDALTDLTSTKANSFSIN